MTVSRIVACLCLCWGLVVLAALCRVPCAAAEGLDNNRSELTELEEQIAATTRNLRSKRVEAGTLFNDLAQLEDAIERLRTLRQRSDRELAELDGQLAAHQGRFDQLRQQQAATERVLKKRLVALYKTGQTGVARSLLSTAGTPLDLAEKYVFLTRIVRHDRELMATYRSQAQELEQILASLKLMRERQAATQKRRRDEQHALDAAGTAKRQLLTGVRSDEARLTASLAELQARAQRLSALIKRLETGKTPSYTEKTGDFAGQREHLPWPVSGRVRTGFGPGRHPQLGTLIESNGLEIITPPQTPVRAVWGGRILYAGPLKGFGNLLVIDHGDKYYSLYGHAASFTRSVGQVVGPQDVVALSGHDERDALYFEIRHHGTPVDPMQWLAPR